jgi:cytochrome c551/c552
MLSAAVFSVGWAQESPKEEDFYKIGKVSAPEGTLLEVGGLATLPNGDLGVATRRGDIFIVENPTSRRPFFRKFASGLHEILGLAYKDGALYCAQRGELTKLVDSNKDGKADIIETVTNIPVSGHYHEYTFGPKIAPDGSYFISGNVAFGDEKWWAGESRVPWRGWIMHITKDGQIEPWATGVRSPAGLGMIDGELFYADNQGDWIGSGGVWHVKKGAFMGHPAGLRWSGDPKSPVKLTQAQLYAKINPRDNRDERGRAIKPENVVDEKYYTLFEMKKEFPEIQLPVVWLPHGIQGISNSEIVKIPVGSFGPFAGQALVGVQGDADEGLQRLTWTNQMPFEMRAVRAMPDGFEVEFTTPVDRKSAEDLASYSVESFIYKYHPVYGSPTVNKEACTVKGVKVSADGLKARVIVDNLRQYYIHNLTLDGVRAVEGSYSLVHPTAYYTLNNIPEGQKLAMTGVSTYNSAGKTAPAKKAVPAKAGVKAGAKTTAVSKTGVLIAKAPTYEEVKPLLNRHTCAACHNAEKRQVGPAFADVAKRGYSNEKILELIYNPKPQNWPDYSTEMPPMPQVPKADALKIAAWINSLAAGNAAAGKNADQP